MEKQVAAKGAGEQQPKGGEGKQGGGKPANVGTLTGGRGERGGGGDGEGEAAKLSAIWHRGDTVQGVSTFVLCQMPIRRQPRRDGKRPHGGGWKQHNKPPPHGWMRQSARSNALRSAPAEPATVSAEALGESPSSNSKGCRRPLWVSWEKVHVTTGVQHVNRCCVLHVCVCGCVLTSVENLLNSESSTVKKELKKFFETVRLVFEKLLQRLKRVAKDRARDTQPIMFYSLVLQNTGGCDKQEEQFGFVVLLLSGLTSGGPLIPLKIVTMKAAHTHQIHRAEVVSMNPLSLVTLVMLESSWQRRNHSSNRLSHFVILSN